MSAQSLFVEGIVLPVSHDDMIQEVDVHHLASPFDALRQLFVDMAGGEVAGGVVVTDGEDGAVGEDSFLHDNTDVDRCFRDAAT